MSRATIKKFNIFDNFPLVQQDYWEWINKKLHPDDASSDESDDLECGRVARSRRFIRAKNLNHKTRGYGARRFLNIK